MGDVTDDPDLRQAATRGDVHRARNDFQRRFEALDLRITGMAVDLATLKAESRPLMEPREMVRAVTEVNGLAREVQDVKKETEANSRRIWVATGGLGALVVASEIVLSIVLRGP